MNNTDKKILGYLKPIEYEYLTDTYLINCSKYQKELMKQAYILSLKQSQKNFINKEDRKYKNNSEYEEEIIKMSNKVAKEALDMVGLFDKMADEDKAELLALLNKLSGGAITKKTDIEIKVNQEQVSLKNYLEEVFSGVDIERVNKKLKYHLKEIEKNKLKSGFYIECEVIDFGI